MMFKDNLDRGEDKTETIRLKDKEYDPLFRKGFIKGLLDTDGFVHKKWRKASFNSISEELTTNVSQILAEHNIENKIVVCRDKRENYRDMYRATIHGESVTKLGEVITPRHPRKEAILSKFEKKFS